MFNVRNTSVLGVLAAVSTTTILFAQELPCWKTHPSNNACALWEILEAPPGVCKTIWDVNMTTYFASRSAQGWTSRSVADYECSGTYWVLDSIGGCSESHTLSWQTSGTQGSGDSCPAGGGGSGS